MSRKRKMDPIQIAKDAIDFVYMDPGPPASVIANLDELIQYLEMLRTALELTVDDQDRPPAESTG